MDLNLKRLEKEAKIRMLEVQVAGKRQLIYEEGLELETLENQLKETKKTEMPILLFSIDESTQCTVNGVNGFDSMYEYIYYSCDFDKTFSVIRDKENDLLPNTIDLRDCLEDVRMPDCGIPGCSGHYKAIIDKTVVELKSNIESYLSNNNCSWKDLERYLKEQVYKNKVKTLV